MKWKYCSKCHHKVNEVASECPYCGSTSFEMENPMPSKTSWRPNSSKVPKSKMEWKVCAKCGKKVNKVAEKCPYCNAVSFNNYSPKTDLKRWKVCNVCGENVKSFYTVCPYCNCESLTDRKGSKLPYFSPLKSVRVADIELKVCPRCGREVGKEVFRCPFCHNVVFEKTSKMQNQNPVVEADDDVLAGYVKHKLFFKKYGEGVYVFSRAKFLTIVVFILLFICTIPFSSNLLSSLVICLMLSLPVYLLGMLSHAIDDDGARYKRIRTRDDSLIRNIIHFMFYWRYRDTNIFTLSKTKIISLLLYIVTVSILAASSPSLLACLIMGLVVFIPALVIGSLMHSDERPKIKNESKPQIAPKDVTSHELPKKENKRKAIAGEAVKSKTDSKSDVKPKLATGKSSKSIKKHAKSAYNAYEVQTEKLKSEFDLKEENARLLIEKRFPAPQITNDKFNAIVDECHDVFYHRTDIIRTIIASSNEYSGKLEDEIQSNILVLNEINSKMDTLNDELLINISESGSKDVQNLLDEIDMLTDSVKDYN